LSSLPANSETVALFLAESATKLKVGTVQRRISAIAEAHKALNMTPPTRDPVVLNTMKGIRRIKGTAPVQKSAAVTDKVVRMIEVAGGGVIGSRDRALILLGFAGAFRRSELAAIHLPDCAFEDDGLIVTIRRSKTDQDGLGRRIGIPYGTNPDTCPIRNVKTWVTAAGISESYLFRSISRHGHVATTGISGGDVARIVKKLCQRAGMDHRQFSGHSLRAGHATAAATAGASEHSIMKQTGHRSVQMVRRYIREGTLFRENSASKLGL
jgi:integrase